jgi:hypothetical protein
LILKETPLLDPASLGFFTLQAEEEAARIAAANKPAFQAAQRNTGRNLLRKAPPRDVFEACEQGSLEHFEKYVNKIEEDGGRFDVKAEDANGRQCIHWAAEGGSTKMLDVLLVEYGANVLEVDKFNKRTCIHFAARLGHAKGLRYLLSSLERAPAEKLVNQIDARGCTAAYLAYERWPDGDEAFRVLLEYGARWTALDLDAQLQRSSKANEEWDQKERLEKARAELGLPPVEEEGPKEDDW